VEDPDRRPGCALAERAQKGVPATSLAQGPADNAGAASADHSPAPAIVTRRDGDARSAARRLAVERGRGTKRC